MIARNDRPDPPRESNLPKEADNTMHRKFDTNSRGNAQQSVGLLLVLFSLVGVLVHELAHRGVSTQPAPSSAGQQGEKPGETATPQPHPNAQTP
jgi:hypothetical protein